MEVGLDKGMPFCSLLRYSEMSHALWNLTLLLFMNSRLCIYLSTVTTIARTLYRYIGKGIIAKSVNFKNAKKYFPRSERIHVINMIYSFMKIYAIMYLRNEIF